MISKLAKKAISKIQEDIQSLSASQFEELGHLFVCAFENEEFIHRGLNERGNPSGYTVDSFNSERDTVAEYSTEKDYFTKLDGKLSYDIKHAFSEAKGLKKLYLISSQQCDNSKWKEVNDTFNKIVSKNSYSDQVELEIFDLRRLSEEIYNQIINKESFYNDCLDYLPSLESIRTDYRFSCNIPIIPEDYISDKAQETQLADKVAESQITVLTGISGIGKSYLLKHYANENKSHFDNAFWIQGDEIRNLESLANVRIDRLGISCNLSAKFNSHRCLLIIDSLEERINAGKFSELKNGLNIGGKIIISSQTSSCDDVACINLHATPTDIAYKILTYKLDDVDINPKACENIIDKSGGHPLLMALIRGLISSKDASWEEINACAENWPEIEDDKARTILSRLLDNHSKNIEKELSLLSWLDSKFFDKEFLRYMIGPIGLKKLTDRSLLHENEHDILKLHDLIHLCLCQLKIEGSNGNYQESFLSFFREKINAPDFHFQRALHMSSEKIKEIAVTNNKPCLVNYLYLLLDCVEKDITKLKSIADANINEYIDSDIDLHAILEAQEKYIYSSKISPDNFNAVNEKYLLSIQEASDKVENDEIRHILLHHQGKTLKRLKRNDEALEQFQKALDLKPNALNTKLQIARLLTTKNNKKNAVELLITILKEFKSNRFATSVTVIIAALVEICRLKAFSECSENGIDLKALILSVINKSHAEGFSQPFELIASVGSALWYDDPNFVIKLYENSFLPNIDLVNAKIRYFDIAQAVKNVGKAYQEQNKIEKAQRLFPIALTYYNNINNPTVYQKTMIAECYILCESPQEAINLLKDIRYDDCNCYVHHRRAQAYELLFQYDEALREIDYAIDIIDNDIYRAAFFDRKANILLNQGRFENAISVWEEALKFSRGKFKVQIQNNIKQAQLSQFN